MLHLYETNYSKTLILEEKLGRKNVVSPKAERIKSIDK